MRKTQFRRALDLCNLGLQDSELCRLEDHYQAVGHADFVDYLRFSDDIEAIFAEPHLERAPELRPRLFKVPDETQTNEVVPDKQQVLDNCLRRIAKRVSPTVLYIRRYNHAKMYRWLKNVRHYQITKNCVISY